MSYQDDAGQPAESFFRSANGSLKPDGTADFTEAITHNGNVGIRQTTDPISPLQFGNVIRNDVIRLWTGTTVNDHAFYGLGINSDIFRYQVDKLSSSHRFYGATGPTASKQFGAFQHRALIVGDPATPIGEGFWRLGTENDDGYLEFWSPTTATTVTQRLQGRILCNAFSGNAGISGTGMQFQTCRTVAGAVLEDRLTINGGGDFIFDAPGLASQAAINGPKAALVTMGGALRIRGGASAGGGAARQNGGIWFGADQTTVNGAVLVPSTASGDTDSGITSIGDNDLTFYVNNQVSARATGLIWSKAGGGLWAALSDIRTKEKVNPYQKGIQEIASLTPISYRYTEASGMGNPREDEDLVGFSAQELDVLFPECVDVIPHEGYEGGVLNADMSPLIPALVNAVKELDARLAAVEKRESAIAAWEAKREVASKASVDRRKEKRAAKVAKQADKFADRQARIEQRIADLKERGKK